MLVQKRPFGQNSRGQDATLYTFQNRNGMIMEVTDFGGVLYSLQVPTKAHGLLDVVLGYDSPAGYERPTNTFFGSTIGRFANRIGNAAFSLNGKTYSLDKNDNSCNNLHSGFDFYNHRVWQVTALGDDFITLSLHSPDGDQGYPGALDVDVTYTLTEDNTLRISYHAAAQADTPLNLTNHSYFNLNGHDSGSILEQLISVDADAFTPTDALSIPTGEIRSVDGTPMDLRTLKPIGQDIDADYEPLVFGKGYDHNWCLNNGGKFAKVAQMTSPSTGLNMDVYTDLPGVQVYTGNFLVEEPGKGGAVYRHRQGICFETQFYPDCVNHDNFPSCILEGGKTFETVTEFRFV